MQVAAGLHESGRRESGTRKQPNAGHNVHEIQTTSADGTPIGYVKRGNGPAVLFVHGTVADHRSWDKLALHLEKHITMHAMDRRGRGLSGDAAHYDLKTEIEDILAVIKSIAEPVVLFGHSFGGLCGLEAALLTKSIRKLILYEPALPVGPTIVPEEVSREIEGLVESNRLEEAMELMLSEVAKISPNELDAYKQTPLWKARIPLARTIPREQRVEEDYRFEPERFKALAVPTVLLSGSESPALYRDAIERLHAAIPNSGAFEIRGQQHIAQHTAPELLAEVLLRIVME